MESGGLCFCKLVHEIHGRAINYSTPRLFVESSRIPSRLLTFPMFLTFPSFCSYFLYSQKGWKDQEMDGTMVLLYQETCYLSRMLLWIVAKSCITNRMVETTCHHWMSLDPPMDLPRSGEDRISQLLSEASEAGFAAKDTEDLEFEVVD